MEQVAGDIRNTRIGRTLWHGPVGHVVRNTWVVTRYALGSHRATFPLLRLTPPRRPALVRTGIDACIEGLPKSANSYGQIVFLMQNPDARLAHHVHVPMQVTRAVRLGIPCAILIREPLPTLTSLMIASENGFYEEILFRMYIDYYGRVAAVREQVAICRFDEVLEDASVIAARLNQRCGTQFNCEPVSGEVAEKAT